jgi:hypothetical protein
VAALPDIEPKLEQVGEFKAISQHIFGSRGSYTQTNIESRRRFTVESFRDLAESDIYRRPPAAAERGRQSTSTTEKTRSSRTADNADKIETRRPLAVTELDDDFTIERCRELERFYWRNLTYNPPYYGADIPGKAHNNVSAQTFHYLFASITYNRLQVHYLVIQ